MNSKHIRVWTIYDHPEDYPDSFIARKFLNNSPTDDIIVSDNLANIEQELEDMGYCELPVHEPNPQIVSVWM